MNIASNIPPGPLAEKWERHKLGLKLISPANKRKCEILVVGTGLAGASAAATLAELGYQVTCFCLHDSPRRAQSICAQGGINAAKNHRNDGDSVWRLFQDTIVGGDFRAREANVYRLAELSALIIDQCAAQGVPFAREYGGALETRSFGGAQVSRTFYTRGQTGQQLLLGAYQALSRQIGLGRARMYPRTEMLDLVVIDGHARGIVARNLVSGEISAHTGHAVVLATGGYGNVYGLSTNSRNSSATAIWRAHLRGAGFANPCFTQTHPTCIPANGPYQSKLTLVSESLRNDARVWVPKRAEDCGRPPSEIPEPERDYYLERKYPSYGNLTPRDIAARAAKEMCDAGLGVGPGGKGVYLDFADAIKRVGVDTVRERYGSILQLYERITGEDACLTPIRIYPAVHYAIGGLWVDYDLMSTVPGLFVLGEANFADHGANRLGASALMQGLADGYFILPYAIGNYLASAPVPRPGTDHPECRRVLSDAQSRINRLLALRGKRTSRSFHLELGQLLWAKCGLIRTESGLRDALQRIPAIRDEFWSNAIVTGTGEELNQCLEQAARVADFIELGELMCRDALWRAESCGCHFRAESQTGEGEARRDDARFGCVAVWEYKGPGREPDVHTEKLEYESVSMGDRNYK